jgi:FKBP-type peptidyl-prolyl cis-trans isomerase
MSDQQEAQLKIEEIFVGTGAEVKEGDTVLVHYKGTLEDGTQFDSSYNRGMPFETKIGVGYVIRGWDMGIPGMKSGGKRKLTIPYHLAYGKYGAGSIPGFATLIFEVELVKIK